MSKKLSLLSPAPVGPSSGPFGPMGGIKRPRKAFKKGGKIPGFFLGSLFSGTPATSTTKSEQSGQSTGVTNNNIASPEYNRLRDQTLTRATDMDFSDPDRFIEGFGGDQLNAFNAIRANQGAYGNNYNQAQGSFDRAQGDIGQASAADPTGAGMGYIDKAGGMGTGSDAFNPFADKAGQSAADAVDPYFNKYQSGAMDAVAQASNRAFGAPGGPMERINDTFTGGNAAQFGRERHGDVMTNAVDVQQQALDERLAQMANTGYGTAMTAAQTDLGRYGTLGQTAGQLANQDITTQQGLGTAAGNLTAQGANTNLAAARGQQDLGTAQQGLGTARQGAAFTDANALLSIGNQQQQLGQQAKSLPMQGLQFQQSMGQGWQLPTSSNFTNTTNSSTTGTGTQQAAQGSPFGQILGGIAGIAGAFGGDDDSGSGGVDVPGAGAYGMGPGSAEGGQINSPFYFNAGGYVPTVTNIRKRNAMRTPPQPGPMGGMGGMQPTGMPGMPPPAPPTAAALNPQPQPPQPLPHPANRKYARGGPFGGDEAQDRAMVERGVHQHERQMHKSTTGELTKLRLARGGSVPGFAAGGFGDMFGAKKEGTPLGVDAPDEGPFGDTLDKPIGPSQANFGQFGPLPSAAPAVSSGGGGGGGGGGMGDIMGMAMKLAPMAISFLSDERAKDNIERVGTTHNGLKIIDYNYKGSPFRQRGLSAQDVEEKHPEAVGENEQGYKMVDYHEALKRAHGGAIPGYAEGGYPDVDVRGGYSPFLDSSAGLAGRLAERDDWLARRPMPPEAVSPEAQARVDSEMEYERGKGGVRRWLDKVYGDIAKPIDQSTGSLGRGDYLEALMPLFAALGSSNPTGGGAVNAIGNTAKELGGSYLAREAAKQAALRRYR